MSTLLPYCIRTVDRRNMCGHVVDAVLTYAIVRPPGVLVGVYIFPTLRLDRSCKMSSGSVAKV